MRIKFTQRDHSDLKSWCGLRIWEHPKADLIYGIGADVAEGVGGDASCAQVLCAKTGRLVASFWSNLIDTDNYAAELYKLGRYYNNAELCVEANSPGLSVLSHLTGAVGGLAYPRLYKRIVYDQFTQKKTKQVGFKTTRETKERIIDNLKAALRDGELLVHDKQTIQELGNFCRDAKSGRLAAKGSGRDDRVMALALAWEVTRISRELDFTDSYTQIPTYQYDPATGFPIF